MTDKMFIHTLILTGLLLSGANLHAEDAVVQTEEDKKVFRKFHPDGVVEFTDQPSKDSEELKVEELPTYKFAPVPGTTPSKATPATRPTSAPTKNGTNAPAVPASPYTALNITSPARNENIRANDGNVLIKLNLTPALQAHLGHQFEYLLDGKSVLKSARPDMLNNLDRGTHTLVVQVIDKNNRVLIHSDSVSFHLQRFFKPRG